LNDVRASDMEIQCSHCNESFPGSQTQCPHCGRPSLFPNVTAAKNPVERGEVLRRYRSACRAVKSSWGLNGLRKKIEKKIRNDAKVVVSMSFNELERLAKSDLSVFSTYYQRVRAGLQIPRGDKWDILRGVVEHAVFPGYKDNIRFGVLSLDGVGVRNYGECSLELKREMVAHRTSLFEDNNVVFTAYDRQVAMSSAHTLEPGHRAIWDDRHKLGVVKLAVCSASRPKLKDVRQLLLQQGKTTTDDRFIELHIWGALTIRAVTKVRVHRKNNRPLKAAIADVDDLLKKYGIGPIQWKP